MRTTLTIALLAAGLATAGRGIAAPPPGGSRLKPDDNNCAKCHGEADLWEKETLRLYINPESLAKDVHFRKGVNCHDCHGGDPATFEVPEAHAKEVDKSNTKVVPFRFPLSEVWKSCGICHAQQQAGMEAGGHGKPAAEVEGRLPAPRQCADCHGKKGHGLLPVRDPASPVFADAQVQLCGKCHDAALDTYNRSVHGIGLHRAGLTVSAVCADCHGAHAVLPSDKKPSSLYPANVAATCGKCHRFIEERLQKSVHGRGGGPGGTSEEAAPGGEVRRNATCTDCHRGHDLPRPASARFRLHVPQNCGNCHAHLMDQFGLSMHGQLTELGYGPAANCSDCHGWHDIVPVADPASPVSAANRRETCAKCHAHVTANFLTFDPHADHRDPQRSPLLYWVYVVLMTFLISTIGVFALHSALWFVRSLVHTLKHGRPRPLVPGERAFVRFRPFHRAAHVFMMVSFLGLALTGLPLKYSQHQWAQSLAFWLGGFGSTGTWHRIFGVVNIACLVVYVCMMLGHVVRSRRRTSPVKVVFGPDSPVFNWRDLKDVFRMGRWFLGLGPKPTFERWAYWEKVDFWGACADIVIIGTTGLILWFPNLFCTVLPGETLNVAKLIHSTQALLATAFVFSIHFFAVLFRPEKFPMDMAVLTGLVSEEEMEEERPEYLERLRQSGVLETLEDAVPSRRVLRAIRFAGFVAMGIGLALLAGIVAAAIG